VFSKMIYQLHPVKLLLSLIIIIVFKTWRFKDGQDAAVMALVAMFLANTAIISLSVLVWERYFIYFTPYFAVFAGYIVYHMESADFFERVRRGFSSKK